MDTDEDIYCTNCNIYFDEGRLERVCQHHILPVPICGPCYDELENKVKLALSNNDYCVWCGQGGDLFVCDKCEKSVCGECIDANLPSGSRKDIENAATWACFSCDESPLLHLSDVLSRHNEEIWFPAQLATTIELLGNVEDQISLCERMNEPEHWGDLAQRIRRQNSEVKGDTALCDDDVVILKERWKRHAVRMDHRKCELQDHLEKQGGNLGAFYRFREMVLRSRQAGERSQAENGAVQHEVSMLGSDEAWSGNDDVAAIDVDDDCVGIGDAGWYIRDLLALSKDTPALPRPLPTDAASDTGDGGSSYQIGSHDTLCDGIAQRAEDSESSDENADEHDVDDASRMGQFSSFLLRSTGSDKDQREQYEKLERYVEKASRDPVIKKYTEHSDQLPCDIYPNCFQRSVPIDVLIALVNVPYRSEDHMHIIQEYDIPPEMEVVLKYASMSFDDGWKSVQWPSLVGVLHSAVVRALYNGSEYEIALLAGHYGVPTHVDRIEDTGDVEELRVLQEEYVGSRGKKSCSASVGFGTPSWNYIRRMVVEEDEARRKTWGRRKIPRIELHTDETDEQEARNMTGSRRGGECTKRRRQKDSEDITAAGIDEGGDAGRWKKHQRELTSGSAVVGGSADGKVVPRSKRHNPSETCVEAIDTVLKKTPRASGGLQDPIDLLSDSDDDGQLGRRNSTEGSHVDAVGGGDASQPASSASCTKAPDLHAWNSIFGRTPASSFSSPGQTKGKPSVPLSGGEINGRGECIVILDDDDADQNNMAGHRTPGRIASRTSTAGTIERAPLIVPPDFVINDKNEVSKLGVSITMHRKFSERLMDHQKEAVKFLWKNTMAGVLAHQAKLQREAAKQQTKQKAADDELCDPDSQLSQESDACSLGPAVANKKSEDIRTLLARPSPKVTASAQHRIAKVAAGGGCVIAHCMGSGKSLTTISFVSTLLTDPHLRQIKNPDNEALSLVHRVLIVAPVNVIGNWAVEFGKWTPPNLLRQINRYSIDSSKKPTDRYNELIKWFKNGGVLITGKELFCRLIEAADRDIAAERDLERGERVATSTDSDTIPKGEGVASASHDPCSTETVVTSAGLGSFDLQRSVVAKKAKLGRNVRKFLLNPGPDIVVLDEAHYLKQTSSQIFSVIDSIRTKRRIALTGSPMQNNLRELWSMIEFVKAGHLNSYKMFEKRFKIPIEQGGLKDANPYQRKQMKYKSHVLYKTLAPIVQRRGMDMLKGDLKQKREFAISVRLTPFQKYLYKRCVRMILEESKGLLFKAVKRGSRVWNHPACLPLNKPELRSTASTNLSQRLAQICKALRPSYAAFLAGFEDDIDSAPGESTERGDGDRSAPSHPSAGTSAHLSNGLVSQPGEKCDVPADPFDSLAFNDKNLAESFTFEAIEDTDDVDDWWIKFPSLSTVVGQESKGTPMHTSDDVTLGLTDESIIGVGSKVLMFLCILSKSIELGDKLVVFSQSLVTLDFLEMILNSNWGALLLSTMAAEGGDGAADFTLGQVGGNLSRTLKNRSHWKLGTNYMRLDGGTPGSKRLEMIDKFTASAICPLFLISTMAGNMGINLQCANRVIIFDASWNPASDLQAIFRCYRYGQQKCVYIYRLLAAGTVEEKMYKKQVTKMSVSARVVDAQMPDSHYTSKEMTAQILEYQSEYECESDESDEEWDEEFTESENLMGKDGGRIKTPVVKKRSTPYEKLARVVASDIVLSDTCRALRDRVQRVADMDPLLMDIEEEHLNDTEKIEAEREFDQEVAQPLPPEYGIGYAQQAAAAATITTSGMQRGVSVPAWMPPAYLPAELQYRVPSQAAYGHAFPPTTAGVGVQPLLGPPLLAAGGAPTTFSSAAQANPIVDYVLKNLAAEQSSKARSSTEIAPGRVESVASELPVAPPGEVVSVGRQRPELSMSTVFEGKRG